MWALMRTMYVAGIDEAGRGPLAGPVSVAGVILSPAYNSEKVRDSKKLTHKDRLELSEEIKANSIAHFSVLVSPEEIDRMNILRATMYGMEQVAAGVVRLLTAAAPGKVHFLVDGNRPFCNKRSVEAIIKGDGKIKCIGAASILAKVERDLYMEKLAEQYPEYLFETHKGYPTKLHKEKIRLHGPSPVHRKTFSGVKEYCHVINERTGDLW
jgi:ribonuclease HII